MLEKHARKSHAWGLFLLIWALILLLLGVGGCYTLYRYLGVYEITRPEPVMDAYIESTDLDEILRQAGDHIPFTLTEFEDPKTLYTSYLDAIDLTRSVSYRLNSGKSTADRLVYDVRCGPNMICNVILTPKGDSPGFGRNSWTVSEVCAAPITDILPSVKAVIDSVSGTELMLNGQSIPDSYISAGPVAISDLSRFESGLESPPSFLTYEVGPLYGEIQLSDAFGRTIGPDADPEEGRVHYQVFGETQTLQIRAPEDLDVFVNGVKLEKTDVASSSLGVLDGLELYTQGSACLTNLYKISGLYLTPTVTASEADGRTVTPVASASNSFTFFHRGEAETEDELLPIAQNYFNAYMDYSAHAFEATRFTNLLSRILPQSSLYEYVYRSQEAMYWASGTQTDYTDLRYENFHKINDYCFVCTVIYSADMTATNWYEQYSYKLENAYELSFVSTNGRWLAAGMNVITGA